jgi:copper transport protein
VLTLIITGTLNSLRQLSAIEQLWQTRYGLILLVKLILVAGTIGVAAISRRGLSRNQVPLRSVRLEASVTATVLVVTAVLSVTAPPHQTPGHSADQAHREHTDYAAATVAASAAVTMSLGKERSAKVAVLPATTAGSHLHIVLSDTNGQPLRATRVTLKVANPGRDIAPIPIPLTKRHGAWFANYRFPFSGTWKVVLTVDGISQSAVVTSAEIAIRD